MGRYPLMATFVASVQFFVKMTRSTSSQPNSPAAFSRQSYTIWAALSDIACPLLPGFPPKRVTAIDTACVTPDGLGYVVAALSKYIIGCVLPFRQIS